MRMARPVRVGQAPSGDRHAVRCDRPTAAGARSGDQTRTLSAGRQLWEGRPRINTRSGGGGRSSPPTTVRVSLVRDSFATVFMTVSCLSVAFSGSGKSASPAAGGDYGSNASSPTLPKHALLQLPDKQARRGEYTSNPTLIPGPILTECDSRPLQPHGLQRCEITLKIGPNRPRIRLN